MRLSQHILPILVLAACASSLVAPDAVSESSDSPAGLRNFGAWTGVCDNVGTCVAGGGAEDVMFSIKITRDADAAAAPQVTLVYAAADDTKDTHARLLLKPEGLAPGAQRPQPIAPIDGRIDPESHEFRVALEAGAPSLALIDAMRDADNLAFEIVGQQGAVSLKGLAATLRWIDAQQGRAGTPTALVAQGMTPIGQVPGPRPLPQIRAARADSVRTLDKPPLTPTLVDMVKHLQDCEPEVVAGHEGTEAWRLGADLALVSVPCDSGAYNLTSALFFTKADGTDPRPVPLPLAPGDDGGTTRNLVVNGSFDPKTMTLNDFSKGRGLGDCGTTRSWIWTGTSFALFEATRQDACAGLLPDDWPKLFRATRID